MEIWFRSFIILLIAISFGFFLKRKPDNEEYSNYQPLNKYNKDYRSYYDWGLPSSPPPIIVDHVHSGYHYDYNEVRNYKSIFDPINYPYHNNPYFYERLPYTVISGGYRRQPTTGQGEKPIINAPQILDISNANVAPTTVTQTGKPSNQFKVIGVAYKYWGNQNDIMPLYAAMINGKFKKYRYFVVTKGKKHWVKSRSNYPEELGSNDEVRFEGLPGLFRVTIYHASDNYYVPFTEG